MSDETKALTLSYNDTPVLFDPVTKMGSLTAMYKACGEPANKSPRDWLRGSQAQEVIDALTRRLNVENSHSLGKSDVENSHITQLVITKRGGVEQGTWAHRQLATIYAHYLNPDFYLAWNQFVFDVLEGKHPALAIEQRLATLESEVAALKHAAPTPRTAPAALVDGQPSAFVAPEQARVLALLADGQTHQFRDLLRTVGKPKSALAVCMHRLVRRGSVRRVGRGIYVKAEESNEIEVSDAA